jgi:hypothetical protein
VAKAAQNWSPTVLTARLLEAAHGGQAFAAAWEEGRLMTVRQAVAYALEQSDADTPTR